MDVKERIETTNQRISLPETPKLVHLIDSGVVGSAKAINLGEDSG